LHYLYSYSCNTLFNPLTHIGVRWLLFRVFSAIHDPCLTYIFSFRHSGTRSLSRERQSAQMSEINVAS